MTEADNVPHYQRRMLLRAVTFNNLCCSLAATQGRRCRRDWKQSNDVRSLTGTCGVYTTCVEAAQDKDFSYLSCGSKATIGVAGSTTLRCSRQLAEEVIWECYPLRQMLWISMPKVKGWCDQPAWHSFLKLRFAERCLKIEQHYRDADNVARIPRIRTKPYSFGWIFPVAPSTARDRYFGSLVSRRLQEFANTVQSFLFAFRFLDYDCALFFSRLFQYGLVAYR